MNKFAVKLVAVTVFLFVLNVYVAFAQLGSVKITEPADGATVSSPVKVCMEVKGVHVEPAKKGVNVGYGHHHILVNVGQPTNLKNPIPKDKQHIHMGDGSTCKEIKLARGKHTIRTLFAQGNHVPYDPSITDTISVNVK
jgi:hypothetical protein